jgi:hypothetical protein
VQDLGRGGLHRPWLASRECIFGMCGWPGWHDDAVGGGLAMLGMVVNLQEMTSASSGGDGGSRFGGERGTRVGRHVVANIVKAM